MKSDQSDHSEPFPREKIPPEVLEWARQTLDEEAFLAHVREVETTGGRRLEELVHDSRAWMSQTATQALGTLRKAAGPAGAAVPA